MAPEVKPVIPADYFASSYVEYLALDHNILDVSELLGVAVDHKQLGLVATLIELRQIYFVFGILECQLSEHTGNLANGFCFHGLRLYFDNLRLDLLEGQSIPIAFL